MLGISLKDVLVVFLLTAALSAQNPTISSDGTATTLVCLNEILIVAPDSGTPEQIGTAKVKAERVRDALRLGGSFADLARSNSQGLSASQGGSLGCFERGQLPEPMQELVFRMKGGDVSDVVRTKQGFVILQMAGDGPESASEHLSIPL